MKALLDIHQLTAGYDGKIAIEAIDFKIYEGEILGLIGPNGAGKSTLLKTIAELITPYKGTIQSPESQTLHKAYVPQQRNWDRNLPLTVQELMALQSRKSQITSLSSKEFEKQALLCLERLGVSHLYKRPLGELSGGECERVMIAFAILSRPQLLLLDEPLAGVDIKGGYDFETIIRELSKKEKITVVMVSHDLQLVSHLSHRVACLNRSLQAIGTPDEVMREHLLSGIYGLPPQSVQHLRELESIARRTQ